MFPPFVMPACVQGSLSAWLPSAFRGSSPKLSASEAPVGGEVLVGPTSLQKASALHFAASRKRMFSCVLLSKRKGILNMHTRAQEEGVFPT